jgi:transposase
MTEEIDWLVGVDWASTEHQVCLMDATGVVMDERAFPHSGSGLDRLCRWLLQTTGAEAGSIGVAIEVPHGPVVETLIERGFVVHAINPKQLDRFRDRFTMAGSKDDRLDARVLADALRTDRPRLRHLHPLSEEIVALREVSRLVEDLQQERTRLTNRLREQLWRYYPQFLQLTDDLGEPWILALWQQAPTPAKAGRIHKTTVAHLLKANRIRRTDAEAVLATLRQPAVQVAPGTAEAACRHIKSLVVRLKVVNRELKEATAELNQRTAALSIDDDAPPGQPVEQRDATILQSMPGIGPIVLATLLAEGSDALRRRDYHALRSLCGVAPVTKRSGKRLVVVMRQACQIRLRNAVYHWARVATQHDAKSRQRYQALRARGHSHARALRSVGDRLLAVACAMLTSGETFRAEPTEVTQPA